MNNSNMVQNYIKLGNSYFHSKIYRKLTNGALCKYSLYYNNIRDKESNQLLITKDRTYL